MKKGIILTLAVLSMGLATRAQQWLGSTTSTNAIYRTGNVGIGTTTPSASLHIVNGSNNLYRNLGVAQIQTGTSTSGAALILESTAGGSATGITMGIGTDNNMYIFRNLSGNFSSSDIKVTIDGTGNMGLGTTAPVAPLHILNGNNNLYRNLGVAQVQTGNATSGAALVLENTAGGSAAGITMGLPGDNNMYIFRSLSGNFLSSDIKVTIDANGSMGIGTSGSFAYTSLTGATLGTTLPPSSGTVKFEANGVIRSLASIVTSDKNLKTNIKPLPNALDIVKGLEGKTYQWTDKVQKERGADNGLHVGFIAQDLQKIIPEVVITDKDGELGVNYNEIIPILSEAIKAQQKQIESQSDQIEELKKMIVSQYTESQNSSGNTSKINVELSDKSVIVLGQNVPNPFTSFTTIEYNVPTDAKLAQINFTTIDGKPLKSVQITEKGKGVINVYSSELANGVYIYSLIVDGKLIDSKKMEIQK
jgi:hypothetical protein